MTRKQKILLVIALTLPELGLLAVAILRSGSLGVPAATAPVTMAGSVLKQNSDPIKQTPLAGVTVTAAWGSSVVTRKSDPSGFFSLTLNPGPKKGKAVLLTFKQADYKTLIMTATKPGDQLYIARLEPLQPDSEPSKNRTRVAGKVVEIRNARVRYSFKDESTVGVGSVAKQFTAPNTGNVPCRGEKPCSPDGRWKATSTPFSLDAGDGDEFRNVRLSCIAGPCAFTRIDSATPTEPARKIDLSVLNWSDTADFLMEADVARTMVTDVVRDSYPYIIGQTLSFALPPSSEGPSIEAELDGQSIVFPLGPALILSWGDCSVEISADGNRIYRCAVKPGYRLQQ